MAIKNNRIKHVLAICMFLLATIFLNCGSSNQIIAQGFPKIILGMPSIKGGGLKLFIRNFETVQFVLHLRYAPQESEQKEQIEENHLDDTINRCYCGIVFFSERYLPLTSFYHTQALSIMEDWHLRIHSFSYEGIFRCTKDIDYHCNSLRLGNNEYGATTSNQIDLNSFEEIARGATAFL